MKRTRSGRRDGKALDNWILIALFIAMLTVPTLAWLAVGDASGGELEEKRALDDFPTQIGNRYVARVESWYGDHAPYRSAAIAWEMRVAQAIGSQYRKRVHPALSALCTPDWYAESAAAGGAAYLAPIEESRVIYGRDDWLFYPDNDSLAFYQGRNALTEAEMASWREAYEGLSELCKRRGVQLVAMVAPNKEQVYPEYMPSYYVQPGPKREERFLDYMRRNSDVTYLYPLEEILAAKRTLPVYKQQDTHWNGAGAYVGAAAACRAMGVELPALEQIGATGRELTGGDLSNFCGLFSTYTDYSVEYRPEVAVRKEAAGGASGAERYESGAPGERRMLLISDSFGEAILPYFVKDFRFVTSMSRYSLERDAAREAWSELSEGDVLVLLAVERLDFQNVDAARKLTEWLQ